VFAIGTVEVLVVLGLALVMTVLWLVALVDALRVPDPVWDGPARANCCGCWSSLVLGIGREIPASASTGHRNRVRAANLPR
jgi:hypothetical protein